MGPLKTAPVSTSKRKHPSPGNSPSKRLRSSNLASSASEADDASSNPSITISRSAEDEASSVAALRASGEDDDDDDDDDTTSSGITSSTSPSPRSFSPIPDTDQQQGASTITPLPRPRPPTKPPISLLGPTSNLLARASSLIQEMTIAKERLDADAAAGLLPTRQIENVAEGEPYIEMDLGLGVWEDRGTGEDPSDGEGDELGNCSSDDGEDDGLARRAKETDVLGQLMGRKRIDGEGRSRLTIQVIEDDDLNGGP